VKPRKILFWIHLAAGSVAGIVILIMSVTGVLLAFQKQITMWADRDLRPTPGATQVSMDVMLASVAAFNAGPPSSITLRADPTAPAEFSFGRERVLLVDVYSGRVLGEGSAGVRSFFRTAENWHRWLAASDEHRTTGRAVTGACNLAFLLLVVSGPFLWLPRTWSRQNV